MDIDRIKIGTKIISKVEPDSCLTIGRIYEIDDIDYDNEYFLFDCNNGPHHCISFNVIFRDFTIISNCELNTKIKIL
jgi:hypothetical protein